MPQINKRAPKTTGLPRLDQDQLEEAWHQLVTLDQVQPEEGSICQWSKGRSLLGAHPRRSRRHENRDSHREEENLGRQGCVATSKLATTSLKLYQTNLVKKYLRDAITRHQHWESQHEDATESWIAPRTNRLPVPNRIKSCQGPGADHL